MYQKKDGDGALFQNKKQSEKQPDVRGDLLLDGREYEIAGWQKATRNGDPWWSLKAQPKRAKPVQGSAPKAAPAAANSPPVDDSDVPW